MTPVGVAPDGAEHTSPVSDGDQVADAGSSAPGGSSRPVMAVVGAVHIRDVDTSWPSAGSQVHHKVGAWPVMIADATEVLACDPARDVHADR